MRRSTIIGSISALGASVVAAGFFAFAAQVLFARQLGQAGYGAIASASSLANLLAAAGIFGINAYWLRVFGRHGYRAVAYIGPSLRVIGASALAVGLLFAALVAVGPFDELTRRLLPWFAVVIAAQSLHMLARARFQLEERFTALALWQIVPALGRLGVALLTMTLGLRILEVGIGFATWSLATCMLAVAFALPLRDGSIRLAGHQRVDAESESARPGVSRVAREAGPFALAAMAYWVYFQCDVILLNWIRGEETTGLYGVAIGVISAFQLVPRVVHQTWLRPMQHRWADHDRERLRKSFVMGNRIMLALGLAGATLVAGASPWVIPVIFGADYVESVALVVMLALCLPLRFLTTNAAGITSTTGLIGRQVRIQLLTAGLNFGLNLLAIPWLGAMGAALTTVISEAVLAGSLQWQARRALARAPSEQSTGPSSRVQ